MEGQYNDDELPQYSFTVKQYRAIHIIAEELDSTGQPYPLDHHDRLFTEDDDADADTYDDSDADAAAYGGDEL